MLNKIDKVLTHVENAITGSLFIASLLVLGWNIIMRKVFHNASTWAEEAIRYAIIWVTFVGSSQCAKSGNHVGIDILRGAAQGLQKVCLCVLVAAGLRLLRVLRVVRLVSDRHGHHE